MDQTTTQQKKILTECKKCFVELNVIKSRVASATDYGRGADPTYVPRLNVQKVV
jgi:hypothetical protein